MSFVYVSPARSHYIKNKYQQAAHHYEQKKKAILRKIGKEQQISGNEFITQLEIQYSNLLNTKTESSLTGREVGISTIADHIYKATRAQVTQVLDSHSEAEIKEQIEALKNISKNKKHTIQQEQRFMAQEINKIVEKYNAETNIDELVSKLLPSYVSEDNKRLTMAQIYAYARSILKKEIQRRASMAEIEKVVKQRPAILLGYMQEDALTDAASDVIKKMQSSTMKAKTVGAARSKIDILIPLTGHAAEVLDQQDNVLSEILQQLDNISGTISVQGESSYQSDEFLGIQSKPWNLNLPTTNWNRNSLGSRGELLNTFKMTTLFQQPNNMTTWDRGALFLSMHLNEVVGENTVMYALKGKLLWTSDLLNDLPTQYRKYFAFMLDSQQNLLTSHVQLADISIIQSKD